MAVPFLALSLSTPGLAADADKAAAMQGTKQQELVTEARYAIEHFANDPGIAWVKHNVGSVKGVFIVPDQVKGAFMIGGSGGSGVMLTKREDGSWSPPAFDTMGSLSFGFQAGGEVSEVVLLIMTEKGLNAFKGTSVKLGGDVSVTAGPVGAGAKAATADVLAFSRQKGLYGGISVEGAVIAERNDWNQAYYGKPVTPAEILFSHKVDNPASHPLREAVARTLSGTQTTGSIQKSE